MLTQKGLAKKDASINNSVHSSAKSSGSYGGNYLKGTIFIKKKINLKI